MTDDDMNVLLQDAGRRWRGLHATAAAVDFEVPVVDDIVDGRVRRSRRTLPAVAASVLAVAALVLGLVVGLGAGDKNTRKQQPVATPALYRRWMLVGITTVGPAVAVVRQVALQWSADGTVQADDGCNHISGSYTGTTTELAFGDLAATAIGCTDPEVQRQVAQVDRILSGTVGWSVTAGGSALVISKPGVGDLTFAATDSLASTDPHQLLSSTWSVDAIESSDSSVGSARLSGVTLSFPTSATFVVRYSCVTESGRVSAGAGRLTLQSQRDTGAHKCPIGPNQDDDQIRRRLTGALTWSIVGDQLTITAGSSGSLVLTRARGH